jgi:heat shock protein HtpX
MFGTFSKRIVLFVLTNLAVMLLVGLLGRLFGLDQLLYQSGYNPVGLLITSTLFGFAGSIISLLLSKRMALWTTGAQVITQPSSNAERWLVETVHQQARRAGIGVPDVAIYEAPEPNAFATGAFRNSALVAVSTGLLHAMDKREVEAVLAHEVSHVANGDMVTMTLLQGVVNTFVIFFSRTIGYLVDTLVFKTERGRGMGYYITSFAAEIVFGLLASVIVMAYSRRREFRADAGAAALVGAPGMISALQVLRSGPSASSLSKDLAAFGINGSGGGLMALLSTHPRIEDRIAALEGLRS